MVHFHPAVYCSKSTQNHAVKINTTAYEKKILKSDTVVISKGLLQKVRVTDNFAEHNMELPEHGLTY